MIQWTTLRARIGQLPASAWALGGFGAVLVVAAFAASPPAALFMLLAAGVWAWASQQARRFEIAESPERAGVAGLPELSPLLEALPDSALLVDAEGRIVSSNKAARRQMQFEARGQFLTSILRHPDVLEAVQATLQDGATGAVAYETTAPMARAMRCTIAPVAWGADRAALLVFHDETARVSTERMRADFLANASHELRTPVASLSLLVETIAGPARDDPAGRERFMKMMQLQIERMKRLIDDLLSLSRIELDEHIPPSDRADLAGVAREVADTLAAIARDKGVTLELVLPEGPVRVVGERFQLTQVAQNLIDNALKYASSGQTVRVRVGASGDREEVIAEAGRAWEGAERVALLTPPAAANRSYAYVRVEDSGKGIEPRFLPRLGERFFRVEREMGDERGGTGLGLAIVKHIVNRHRGGLLVESQPGRGSAFAAYVELAEEG